jgi:hypothetical protein
MVTGLALAGLACGGNAEPEQPAAQTGAPRMAAQTGTSETPATQPGMQTGQPAAGSAAGVAWTVPARWQAQPDRPMRVATYAVPAAEGDPEAGECAVFFFGAGQGGSIELNVTRWRDQFSGPDGKPAELNQQISTINGLKLTTVSVAGTYLASMGPMFQSGQVKKPGFRMLGAIIEAPEGNVFIKFTGPEKTVAAAESEFKELLNSVRK